MKVKRKKKKSKGNGKYFMIIPITLKVRNNFKKYAKAQGVSMQLAANTLFITATKQNFPIETRMKIR